MLFGYRFARALIAGFISTVILFAVVNGEEIVNFVEFFMDGENGIDSLSGSYAVEVSPDGAHVYSVASFDDAVNLFHRDTVTGTLTFAQALVDNTGGVDGLEAVRDLVISPDGKHIYTAALLDGAVAVFERNPSSGQLAFVEAEFDTGLVRLSGATGITISPDGQHVYVAASSDDAVTVFERDAASGALTFVQTILDGQLGTDGLDGVRDITISSDGKHVYTASNNNVVGSDNGVAVFERDSTSGVLSFVEAVLDGTNGVAGLAQPITVKVSPDDRHVYVGNYIANSASNDWYAVFQRDTVTGRLTFVESGVNDLANDCTSGVSGDSAIAFRHNGSEVVMTSTWRSGLYRFRRDTSTGRLTPIGQLCSGFEFGFFGTRDLAVSPDELSIYGTSLSDGVSVFLIGETSISINYPNGQPGSYFTITGQHFPAGETAIITVNGQALGSVPVDGVGRFTFLLDTTGADEGQYFVTAAVNPSGTVLFVLDSAAPLRPQQGSGTSFSVPAGIAFTETVYLPLIVR